MKLFRAAKMMLLTVQEAFSAQLVDAFVVLRDFSQFHWLRSHISWFVSHFP